MNKINLNTINFNGEGGGGSIVLPSFSSFPATGAEGMIYIDDSTKLSYFWDKEHLMYQGIRSANRNPTPGPGTDEGIYIKYTDGTISDTDTLIEGKTPVGIAYYSNNLKLVLHPNGFFTTWSNPDNFYVASEVQGGLAKTEAILAAVENGTLIEAPAAQWAHNTIWADGSQGWLPSIEEIQMFGSNVAKVNEGLTTIGGVTLPIIAANYVSSSTEGYADTYTALHLYPRGIENKRKKLIDLAQARSVTSF